MKEGETTPITRRRPTSTRTRSCPCSPRPRDYLKLLINGAGKGARAAAATCSRFSTRSAAASRHRDAERVVATRRRNLRRLIHNYGSMCAAPRPEDRELTTPGAELERGVRKARPRGHADSGAIARRSTLARLRARCSASTSSAGPPDGVRGAAAGHRRLAPPTRAPPLAVEIEPVLRTRIRPFVREARRTCANLRPAPRTCATRARLPESFFELNRLFNMASYNPAGAIQ